MAWVRYDDGFHDHDKVAALRSSEQDVAALALHLLANTWTSRRPQPGYVPKDVPAMLVGVENAKTWTKALVKAKLWERAAGGWSFVNHEKYRAPTTRQTPGTPSQLSAKRAAAGRAGGKQTASKRQANGAANAASVQQDASKPCSPVVASNEATPEPAPVPTTSGQAPSETDGQRAQRLTKTYTDRVPMSAFLAVRGVVAKAIKAEHNDQAITDALGRLADSGRPVTADTLRIEIEGMNRSTTRPKFGISYGDADREGPAVAMTGSEWATDIPRSSA